MNTKRPEAIRIAEWLEGIRGNAWPSYIPQEAAAELRRQHAENESVRTGYDAARLEIASLHTQMEAVGAGGMEPLRKCCLHQISEPANAGWCDGCSPDNCGGCVNSAAPVDADTGRLNWLERHSDGFYNLDRISAIVGKGFLTGPFTLGLQTNHATLREAIDAARAAQKGSQ